jgi:hypothetical protein
MLGAAGLIAAIYSNHDVIKFQIKRDQEMIKGYEPVGESGYVKLSDKVDAVMKNIQMFLDGMDVYDESTELLTKYALVELEEIKRRLMK